jgi:hypothetical protein
MQRSTVIQGKRYLSRTNRATPFAPSEVPSQSRWLRENRDLAGGLQPSQPHGKKKKKEMQPGRILETQPTVG